MIDEIESQPQLKINPIAEQVSAARTASGTYKDELRQYDYKAVQAEKAGLAYPGKPPELTDQITTGQRLDQIGLDTWRQFEKAQKQWADSGQKDHSALDTAIQSLGDIADPLDRFEATSAAIVQFMDRTDFPFADVTAVAAICPDVLFHPGLVSRLTTEAGQRIYYRDKKNYLPEVTFLDTVITNSEYLTPETVTQARLYRGEVTGLKIDKLLESAQEKNSGWTPTIPSGDLLNYLNLPANSGILESQIGNHNPTVLEVPGIVARLSCGSTSPAVKEHLQGVAIGLVESMLSRRPKGAFPGSQEGEEWKNLTTAAHRALANLHDPETFDLWKWILDLSDQSTLHQKVAKINQNQGNMDDWRKLSAEQSGVVRQHEKQLTDAAKAETDRQATAEAAAKAAEVARQTQEAARKAEAEKTARQAIISSFSQNPGLQTALRNIDFDHPQLDLSQISGLTPEQSQFAQDVLTQFQQLSSIDAGIVIRTSETVGAKRGFLGIGSSEGHQVTHLSLNKDKFDEVSKKAKTINNGQVNLSQQAILEALSLIHKQINPPTNP